VEAFLEEGEQPVFSAYARDPDYRISSPGLILFEPGRKYRWRVQGFDEENRLIARSAFSGFTFSDQSLFRKGLVLLGFEDTPEGLERIEEVSRRYSLRLLEAQEIKTLRLRLALFQTETEIFGLLEALKDEKGVVFQQPDYIFRTMAEPMADLQKVNKLLNLTQVHEHHRGRGVTVAVVDTGVDLAHRDLKDRIAGSGNFISDSPYQGEIHGTAVAGIIGAGTNNFGIEGIAPQAGILALRACRQVSAARPEGECFSSTLARALDQSIEQKARVVNLSFGAGLADPLLSRLIDAGSKRNILFVAAVGNRPGLKEPTFPASHPAVVGVGGIDDEGRPFPNAAVAAKARVSAPAAGIFTTIPGDKHNFLNGTSMSSAIVSGILALAVEEKGNLNQGMLPRFNGDLCRWQEELLSIQVCGQ